MADSRARRRSPSGRRISQPAPAKRGRQPGQVGRRPSSPAYLALLGLLWFGCGVIALIQLHATWKLIPGIVFIGIGLFFLRGAATAAERRNRR